MTNKAATEFNHYLRKLKGITIKEQNKEATHEEEDDYTRNYKDIPWIFRVGALNTNQQGKENDDE